MFEYLLTKGNKYIRLHSLILYKKKNIISVPLCARRMRLIMVELMIWHKVTWFVAGLVK